MNKYGYHESMARMMAGKYPTDPCGFLKEMIHHHQVAVEMAEEILPWTKNSRIRVFAWKVIYDQKEEIVRMRRMQGGFNYQSPLLSHGDENLLDEYFSHPYRTGDSGVFRKNWGAIDRTDPNYSRIMEKMMSGQYPRNDYDFLHEMIVHHQIAVEMSRVFQAHTTVPQYQNLTRDLIWNQTLEISQMKWLLGRYSCVSRNDPSVCGGQGWDWDTPKFSCYYPVKTTNQGIASEKCELSCNFTSFTSH